MQQGRKPWGKAGNCETLRFGKSVPYSFLQQVKLVAHFLCQMHFSITTMQSRRKPCNAHDEVTPRCKRNLYNKTQTVLSTVMYTIPHNTTEHNRTCCMMTLLHTWSIMYVTHILSYLAIRKEPYLFNVNLTWKGENKTQQKKLSSNCLT